MKAFFKYFWPYAAICAVAIVLLLVLGKPILLSLANAVVGEQFGKIIAGYAMALILPACIFVAFHVRRARSIKIRRDYLNAMRDIAYHAREDRRTTLKSKEFRMELVGMASVTLLLTIFYMPVYIILFPLFVPFNIWSWGRLHKVWIQEKKEN